MGAKAYSREQMAEAVALAMVIGAERASEELGPKPTTIRKWMDRAGKAPADAIANDDWAAVGARAMARAHRLLDDGRVNGTQALTMAAIALRNAAKPTVTPPDSAVTAREAYWDWVFSDDVFENLGLLGPTEDTDAADNAALGYLQPALIGIANDEPGQPHRSAMLAWFSGRTEYAGQPILAGDVLPWAQAQTLRLLEEHGGIHGLKAAMDAEREADHQAMVDQLERNRLAAAEWTRKVLSEEDAALLAAAEAFLADRAEQS